MRKRVEAVNRYRSSFAPCKAVDILETNIAPTLPATPDLDKSDMSDAKSTQETPSTSRLTCDHRRYKAKPSVLVDVRLEYNASCTCVTKQK